MRQLRVLRYFYPLLAGTDHRICHNVQLEISSAESLMGLRPGGFTHSSSTSILDNETSWWRRILFLASHKLLGPIVLTFQQTDVWWLQLLNTTHSNTNLHRCNTYRVIRRPAWSCHCNINKCDRSRHEWWARRLRVEVDIDCRVLRCAVTQLFVT